MTISPDGAFLVTTGVVDRSVRIWDATSGAPRGELLKTDSGVTDLAFSPDGTTLAVAQGDGTATLWGVAPPRERGSVRAQGRALQSVAFSNDGRLLATGGMDGAVRFWDLARVLGGQSSAKDRARGDRGGNDTQVRWFTRGSNMHRVWDSDIIDRAGDFGHWMAELIAMDTPEARVKAMGGSVEDWATESLLVARGAYVMPETGALIKPGRKLGDEYQAQNLPIVKRRIDQAGVRLAWVLNQIWSEE
jgi:hypothetical protein